MEEEEGKFISPPPGGSDVEEEKPEPAAAPSGAGGGGGGGWGGWGFSSLSVFSDLQKAAEEISRNAVAAAKSAAQGIGDLHIVESDSEATDDDAKEKPANAKREGKEEDKEEEEEGEKEIDKLRKAALDKLEKASEDSIFGQGLKVLDSSVETFASGAWSALGNALKGGANLVSKLENSAINLADSIQQGTLPDKATSLAPSLIETGKSFTSKGMQVLERVGKETMDLIIAETGLDVEKNYDGVDQQGDEEQFEEVSFDRCFYIYGGPDQLEELETLSNHHALLFNRRKAKLSAEQKSLFDGKLREIQQICSLGAEVEEIIGDTDKGKTIETLDVAGDIEMKKLRDLSIKKAADMAAGFMPALGGLAANDIIQQSTDRLDTIHSEGIHRISELCCSALSQLLMLGKSVISNANKSKSEDVSEDASKIDWPEDSVSKAKIIKCKAQAMSGDIKTVSNSFMTGISDILEAHVSAIHNAVSEAQVAPPQRKVEEKASMITNHLLADITSAVEKIQDALQYLPYVLLSTSMPSV